MNQPLPSLDNTCSPSTRPLLAGTALLLALQAMPAAAGTSILFIGNSFNYGALATVQSYNTSSVTDLVGTNIGGVPALFNLETAVDRFHPQVRPHEH